MLSAVHSNDYFTSVLSEPPVIDVKSHIDYLMPFTLSINLFSQLCNNKNECQQNNVKHSDGLPEKQIAHLSWSPK